MLDRAGGGVLGVCRAVSQCPGDPPGQVRLRTTVLKPLYEALRGHVFAAARIRTDDTSLPVLYAPTAGRRAGDAGGVLLTRSPWRARLAQSRRLPLSGPMPMPVEPAILWRASAGPGVTGRKACLFAGSDHGGERAAVICSLIATAKLDDVDPPAWLAFVLVCIADHPIRCLDKLLPWHGCKDKYLQMHQNARRERRRRTH
jgi:hypothetical protein